jgi:hypothetical protein
VSRTSLRRLECPEDRREAIERGDALPTVRELDLLLTFVEGQPLIGMGLESVPSACPIHWFRWS